MDHLKYVVVLSVSTLNCDLCHLGNAKGSFGYEIPSGSLVTDLENIHLFPSLKLDPL